MCSIIYTLTGERAYFYKKHIWFDSMPTEGKKIEFDALRKHIPPKRFVDMKQKILERCFSVTLENIHPSMRLRFELCEKDPHPAVTRAVKDYVIGKIELDALNLRDIFTCMTHSRAVVWECIKEAI
jgi:hypothetical protein